MEPTTTAQKSCIKVANDKTAFKYSINQAHYAYAARFASYIDSNIKAHQRKQYDQYLLLESGGKAADIVKTFSSIKQKLIRFLDLVNLFEIDTIYWKKL